MRDKNFKYCKTIFQILSLVLFTSNINAQVEEIIDLLTVKNERTLNNHVFTPNTIVRSPFITTSVRTSLGIGGIDAVKIPILEINDKEYKLVQGDIVVALLGFEYQHGVKDWLAVHLRLNLLARLGTDFATILTEGVNYGTAFNIGWMAKIYKGKKFMLSANVEVTNGNYSFISLKNLISNIIESTKTPKLSKTNNALYGLSGIRCAYGLNHFLGFEVMFDIGYGETIQRDLENSWFNILGINADMNFSEYIKTPLALSIGYMRSSYSQGYSENMFNKKVIFTQLSYIGRSDIVLSFDFQFSKERTNYSGEDLWIKAANFTMRYLF